MKLIPFYGLLLLSLFLCNCNEINASDKNSSNLSIDKIIDRPGKYVSTDFNTILNIEVRDNILVYSISDTTGIVLYKSTPPNASTFHNWFFAIDKYGDIWFNSSDIGVFKMKRSKTGIQFENIFRNSADLTDVPKSIYDNLPSSLQRKARPY